MRFGADDLIDYVSRDKDDKRTREDDPHLLFVYRFAEGVHLHGETLHKPLLYSFGDGCGQVCDYATHRAAHKHVAQHSRRIGSGHEQHKILYRFGEYGYWHIRAYEEAYRRTQNAACAAVRGLRAEKHTYYRRKQARRQDGQNKHADYLPYVRDAQIPARCGEIYKRQRRDDADDDSRDDDVDDEIAHAEHTALYRRRKHILHRAALAVVYHEILRAKRHRDAGYGKRARHHPTVYKGVNRVVVDGKPLKLCDDGIVLYVAQKHQIQKQYYKRRQN